MAAFNIHTLVCLIWLLRTDVWRVVEMPGLWDRSVPGACPPYITFTWLELLELQLPASNRLIPGVDLMEIV